MRSIISSWCVFLDESAVVNFLKHQNDKVYIKAMFMLKEHRKILQKLKDSVV